MPTIIKYKEADIQRDENVVLYNVNFEVHTGEFVYLTGVVGSGKSSLLKTIYGELDITTGTAEVLGHDMRRIKRRQIPALRKKLGIVFQDFRLLPDRNVRKNLDFVLRATGWKSRTARADRISEVLATVGLADKLEAMPYELSGGEQQRICIARAILNNPVLILADEATGNQDVESGLRTAHILHDLSLKGTAVIMATHNNDLISRFNGTVYECKEHRLIKKSPNEQEAQETLSSTHSAPEGATDASKAGAQGIVDPSGAEEGAASPLPNDIPVAAIANIHKQTPDNTK
ncbi:MAG: ATP-binding cassette domain-containing protein [Bacteroidales bacterium]|nr:ATP-binding cassette domain-containing protein [Bacteroidales bacterium]